MSCSASIKSLYNDENTNFKIFNGTVFKEYKTVSGLPEYDNVTDSTIVDQSFNYIYPSTSTSTGDLVEQPGDLGTSTRVPLS